MSFIQAAIQGHIESEWVGRDLKQELLDFINGPLEIWVENLSGESDCMEGGKSITYICLSIPFLSHFHNSTNPSTQHWLGLQETTWPSKTHLLHQSEHSPVVALLITSPAIRWSLRHLRHYRFWRAATRMGLSKLKMKVYLMNASHSYPLTIVISLYVIYVISFVKIPKFQFKDRFTGLNLLRTWTEPCGTGSTGFGLGFSPFLCDGLCSVCGL